MIIGQSLRNRPYQTQNASPSNNVATITTDISRFLLLYHLHQLWQRGYGGEYAGHTAKYRLQFHAIVYKARRRIKGASLVFFSNYYPSSMQAPVMLLRAPRNGAALLH